MKGVAFHEEGADTLHQGNEARLNEISGDITKLWIRRVNLTEIATEGMYEDDYSTGRIRVLKQWRILKESTCANLPFETGQELLSRFALENVLSQNCHLKSPGLFWSAPQPT